MKWLITILFFFFLADVYAQQDSVSVKTSEQKGYVNKLREKLNETKEKLSISKLTQIDSLKNANQKLDSLTTRVQHNNDPLSSIHAGKNLNSRSDSLQNQINLLNKKGSGVTGLLNHNTDSLRNLAGGLNTLNVQNSIKNKSDSLQSKINSLTKLAQACQTSASLFKRPLGHMTLPASAGERLGGHN
jgi:hypothetical protein